jgi:hypothetical protein
MPIKFIFFLALTAAIATPALAAGPYYARGSLCLPFNPSGQYLIYWGRMQNQTQMRKPGFLVRGRLGSQCHKCRDGNPDGIFGRHRGSGAYIKRH